MKKIKRKGGAEKLRDKKKKKLEDEAKECKSISQMFFQVNKWFECKMVQPIIGNRYNYLVQLRKDIIKLYKFIIIILLIALHK